jgi:hypothetical protein
MPDCRHEDFTAQIEVNRIADDGADTVRHFVAEFSIACSQCGQPFHFVGVPAGLSFTKPTVDVGATTLHAPIAPGEAPPPARLTFEVS